jgi:hypothetical protein
LPTPRRKVHTEIIMDFVILPYATTRRSLTIRGLTLRSSEDLAGLDDDTTTHLRTLFRLFYLHETLRFKRMIYHYSPETASGGPSAFHRKLWEVSTCLKYICTSPNPPRFPAPTFAGLNDFPATEIAEMFLFTPTNLVTEFYLTFEPLENVEYAGSEPESSYQKILHGYVGIMVGRGNTFRIGPACKILPPHFVLDNHRSFRYGLDVAAFYDALTHGSKWAIKRFMDSDSKELTDLEKRILKALDWFNQSCEYAIHPFKSLVFLAIAFETLLNLKWEQKNTQRIKDVLITLLGAVDRLDTWIDQFFVARGGIVHTGEATHVLYYPPQDKTPQGDKKPEPNRDTPTSLLTYQGRLIFHLCLDAVLSSSVTAREANLQSTFKHDDERIKEIRALLDNKDESLDQRIIRTRNVVLELCGNIYQPASRVKAESMLKITSKMMSVYLGSKLHETLGIPDDIVASMTDFVTQMKGFDPAKDKTEPRIQLISEVHVALRTWYSDSLQLGGFPRDEAFDILTTLMNYSVEYLRGFA